MSRVEIVEDDAALAALDADWWALWRRIPEATPFQTPAWLLPWWRHFRPGSLQVVTVWDGDGLAALAPLYRETGPQGRRLLFLGMSVSDHLDVLVGPTRRAGTLGALADGIASLDWDRCDFEELPPGATALELAPLFPGTSEPVPQSPCPILPLDGPDAALRSVPARKRRQLRRAQAFAEKRGAFRVDDMQAQPIAFFESLSRLHRSRWESRGQAGVLADPVLAAFHREALPALAAADLVDLYALSIGDRLAAAYYGLRDAEHAYAYLGGFDPDFAYESPGAILIGHALERAAARGATTFDFLRGGEAYKYAWGAEDRWNSRVTIARPAS